MSVLSSLLDTDLSMVFPGGGAEVLRTTVSACQDGQWEGGTKDSEEAAPHGMIILCNQVLWTTKSLLHNL